MAEHDRLKSNRRIVVRRPKAATSNPLAAASPAQPVRSKRWVILIALLVCFGGLATALFPNDPAKEKTVTEVDAPEPSISKYATDYGALSLPQIQPVVAEHARFGRNGIAIVATNRLVAESTQLEPFTKHKAAMGLEPVLVTEDDFGGGVGEEAAHGIRKWLQEHHESLNLLYVLFIGDPHPVEGGVPMKMLSDPYKATDESTPTDFFYADLTGTFDYNGNGVDGEPEDYEHANEGGMDCAWDLLVGRIPCYPISRGGRGVKSADEILEKTIRYETEVDQRWRYQFVVTSFNKHLPDSVLHDAKIDYRIAGGYGEGGGDRGEDRTDFGGRAIDYLGWENMDILRDVTPGGVRIGGHGNTTFCGGLRSDRVLKLLSPERPSLLQLGGCQVAHPEQANNLAFSLLRSGCIGVYGGTRSVTSYTAWLRGSKVGDRPAMREFAERCLVEGSSQGYALWETYREISAWASGNVSATMLLINLYGDPSVRPFPTGAKPPYAVDVSPGHFDRIDARIKMKNKVGMQIRNRSDKSLRLQVRSDCEWLTVSPSQVIVEPGKLAAFACSIDYDRIDGGGRHAAQIRITGDAGIDRVRTIEVIVPGEPAAAPEANQPPRIADGRSKLKPANVADINWMADLGSVVSDPESERLRFKAVRVPAWITVHPDGLLQTPHGAPSAAAGSWQPIVVRVSDPHGASTIVERTVYVIQ